MKEHQVSLNIKKACKTLNVSRTGYYKLLNHNQGVGSARPERLSEANFQALWVFNQKPLCYLL